MNTIYRTLASLEPSYKKGRVDSYRVKGSGKLWDWCQERLKPLGLHVDTVTPKTYGVYREKEVIGCYNTLTEVKQAITGGYVTQPNL